MRRNRESSQRRPQHRLAGTHQHIIITSQLLRFGRVTAPRGYRIPSPNSTIGNTSVEGSNSPTDLAWNGVVVVNE